MMHLESRTNRLDFGTDPDPGLDTGSIFPLFRHREKGILGFKYKLKETMQMNIYDIFGRVGLRITKDVNGSLNSMSVFLVLLILHCVPKKLPPFCFNSVKRGPISIFFWYTESRGNITPKGCKFVQFTLNSCCTTLWNAELMFIDCLYNNIVKKLLIRAVKVWIKNIKVNGFLLFSYNFFTPKLYRFPHKKNCNVSSVFRVPKIIEIVWQCYSKNKKVAVF